MGEGFSGFTADQWRTFILIYATTITWDFLKDEDRKILSYFVRACNILVCHIISKSGLKEAHKCLLSMVKLVERQYGPEKITPNMHLCLHICECALDYGPLYSFWCYSFERMNGLLSIYNLILYLYKIFDVNIQYHLQVHCPVVIDISNLNFSRSFNTILPLMSYQNHTVMNISTFRYAYRISLLKKVSGVLQ